VFRSNLSSESVIFKIAEFENEGADTFNYEDFECMRKDMLVTERLSSNPYFVDMYGFCGLSMFSELMPYGDLEEYALPANEAPMKLSFFNETTDVKPLNGFDPAVKLIISLQMAEAVAFLHNHESGVIVHDDIQLSQFLLTFDGRGKEFDSSQQIVKLNDFNRAEVMLFDEENQEYCRYRTGPGNGGVSLPCTMVDSVLLSPSQISTLSHRSGEHRRNTTICHWTRRSTSGASAAICTRF